MRTLRLQLIATLLLVALLPAVPAALVVNAIIQRSFDSRLEAMVEESARAGLASSRDLLSARKAAFLERIERAGGLDTLTADEMSALSPRDRETLRAMENDPPPDRARDETVLLTGPHRVSLESGDALAARVRAETGDAVWVLETLPEEWVRRADTMTESIRLVETLKRERTPVIRSLVLTFVAVFGAILVIVVVLGLLLASRLTRPLDELGAGIERVAGGDWTVRVKEPGQGTLRRLVGQFNQMVGRLRTQQDDLVRLEKQAAWRGLARRLAHEIKNPLTPIQLAAQEVRDAYPGEDATYRELVGEAAGIIEEEVESLRGLVQEFSQFARLPEPTLRETDLDGVLAGVAALYGDEKLRLAGPEKPGRVWCDPDDIHRVLINLVNNALQAQSRNGSRDPAVIAVETRSNQAVTIRVEDRGPGVPEELRARIFEPDFSTRSEGMGLGLAIVEGIVRAHGSSIGVSDREGGGAVFTFSLHRESPQTPETGRTT